ncbi:MAG: zinc metallopeptidase [Clostridia bacterium]|nr:zinc metallopeptidase [Clostridia bacterium]
MISYYLLLIAIVFTFYAQARVSSAFRKYSRIANKRGITGAEAARLVLDRNGLSDVEINLTRGSLTDNYNPKDRTLNLSETVYGSRSIAAVSVACHEVGHAIQHSQKYTPLVVRNSIFPVVNFSSKLTWPLIIVGLILLSSGSWELGNMLFNIGLIAFLCIVAFHLVTLPVEFNASSRAIDELLAYGIVDTTEVKGSKKVLKAAALTYVAALAAAVANLLRLLAIRGNN